MEDNQKVLVKKCFHATQRCFIKACKAVWERTGLMELFIKNISITVTRGKIRQNFHLNSVKTKLKWFSRCVPSEAVSSIVSSFTLTWWYLKVYCTSTLRDFSSSFFISSSFFLLRLAWIFSVTNGISDSVTSLRISSPKIEEQQKKMHMTVKFFTNHETATDFHCTSPCSLPATLPGIHGSY